MSAYPWSQVTCTLCAESFSCDTLQDQRRMGLLLQILDSNTYADLCSGEVPRCVSLFAVLYTSLGVHIL